MHMWKKAAVFFCCLCLTGTMDFQKNRLLMTEAKETAEQNGTDLKRQVEKLDRGCVALHTQDGIYLSWRFFGTDPAETSFEIYRDGNKITEEPVVSSTNYLDKAGTTDSVYKIHTLVDGKETEVSESIPVYADHYFDIPIQKPANGFLDDGTTYDYSAGDASCGDLDGDGEYEIVLKWDPSNTGDNMADGFRGNVYLDAYKLDGTFLWRIDLGRNIRAGQHYTPFLVYDFDGDGYAEVVCKTADATKDGVGGVIGDETADWRGPNGEIITGPEYLTLFDGQTGQSLDTVPYEVARGDVNDWGDDFGNRSERYLAAAAYLDGEKPSVVMCRGYYQRTTLSAWDIKDKKIIKRWIFDSNNEEYADYAGQGNHNLAVADADGDGYDEIIYGSCTIDHDGTGLYTTGLGHGDALSVGDFDPDREGLEVFQCHEHEPYGVSFRAAEDGKILFRHTAGGDTGRSIAGNFLPGNPGAEFAYSASDGIFNTKGDEIGKWSSITKWSQNFAVYWDGNLEREAMDRGVIDSYGGRILTTSGCRTINSTKANCCLSADILGDWREEVIYPLWDSSGLRVYMTGFPTEYRIATLMHDTQYRCQVASQNVGYNQPPNPSFFLGTGYDLPEQPSVVYPGEEQDIAGGDASGGDDAGNNASGGNTDGETGSGNSTADGSTAGENGTGSSAEDGNTVITGDLTDQNRTLEAISRKIFTADTDQKDIEGSSFALFHLKAAGKRNSVKLTWKKVPNVSGYQLYGAACGKKMKRLGDYDASVKCCNITKLAKAKYYKYMLTAYKTEAGKKICTAISPVVHVTTTGGSRYGNPTGIVYAKTKVNLKTGNSYQLKPKIRQNGKVKMHIAKIRYESSNFRIAKVSRQGKIRAIGTGTCYIYMYAQNGCYKSIKVRVKK